MITQELLKKTYSYDPCTGLFTRISDNRFRDGTSGYVAGSKSKSDEYIRIRFPDRAYLAHRLAWLYMTGELPEDFIDHIDMNKRNNKFSNLRDVNKSQNGMNTRKKKNNTSGYKGVAWHKQRKKWRARVFIDGVDISLGLYDDISDAIKAHKEGVKEHHGKFGRVS